MANAMFGWRNVVPGALSLTYSTAAPGLDTSQLRNDQGSPSTAWQTTTTSAALIIDSGNPAQTWRALCLARTNMTSAAFMAVQIGTPFACLGGLAIPTDSTASPPADLYNYTTRTGTDSVPAPNGAVGTMYTNGSSSSFVGKSLCYTVTAGQTYIASGYFRRTALNGNNGGFALVVQGASGVLGYLPLAAIPADTAWHAVSTTFTAAASGLISVYFANGTGALQFSVAGGLLTQPMSYAAINFGCGVRAGFGQALHVMPADQTGQAMRLDISDAANPDGFLNFPLIYAGPVWQPMTNTAWDTVFGRDDQTDEVVSRGGQEFPSVQYVRRRWDVSLQGIRTAETWPQAMDLDRFSRTGSNVLFLPDPAGADLASEALFGRAKSLADMSWPNQSADRRGWKVRITERL